MNVVEMLQVEEDAIVAEALTAVGWLPHYDRDGAEVTRERLRALCRLVAGAIRSQDLGALVSHARRIARERHQAGYDRAEVTDAFSAVEQAIWHRALATLPADQQTWALSLVGTALLHAREALGRAFAEAAGSGAPSFVDLSPLFRGAPGKRDRFREDLVHPV